MLIPGGYNARPVAQSEYHICAVCHIRVGGPPWNASLGLLLGAGDPLDLSDIAREIQGIADELPARREAKA